MRVFNKTKNRVVAEDAAIARTLEEKSTGLTKYETPHAMYFETRWGACPVPIDEHGSFRGKVGHALRNIFHPLVDFPLFWCGVHTFGMRFPIDVVVLDGRGIVRALKKNMPPKRFFFWSPLWKRILELPSGSAIEIGDELKLV